MVSCKSAFHTYSCRRLLAVSDSGRVAGGDEFIANLWKIHLRVKEEGYVQVSISTLLPCPRVTDCS